MSDYAFHYINFFGLKLHIPEFAFGMEWDAGFIHQITWQIGSVAALIGFTIFVHVIEKYLLENRTKLFFTIIGTTFTILTLIFGQLIRSVLYFAVGFMGFTPLILYLYFAYISSGEMRKKSLNCAFSVFLVLFGIVLDSALLQRYLFPLNIPSKIIGALLVVIGLIIFNHQYEKVGKD